MKYILSAAFLAVSILSYSQETKKVQAKPAKLNVKVVNEEDPICGMKTAEYLKDTANYKGKTYGFCNSMCKDEFKKDPEKFAVK